MTTHRSTFGEAPVEFVYPSLIDENDEAVLQGYTTTPTEIFESGLRPSFGLGPRLGYQFVPSELDRLEPDSEHHVRIYGLGGGWLGRWMSYRQEIETVTTEHGMVVSETSFGSDAYHGVSGEKAILRRKLLPMIGWTLLSREDGETEVTGIPTPLTVQRAAALHGVEVKLLAGEGLLSSEPYLSAFRDGQFPVATGQERHYYHDIYDDHLTAMVLGGAALTGQLRQVAQKMLATRGEHGQADASQEIDTYTSSLRLAVEDVSFEGNFVALRAYKASDAKEALIRSGYMLGIDGYQSRELLEISKAKAAEIIAA